MLRKNYILMSLIFLSGLSGPVSAFTQSMGLAKLPWVMDGKTKVFQLKAEKILTTFCDGTMNHKCRPVQSWGYNGSMPGPTIEVTEGDHVRIQCSSALVESMDFQSKPSRKIIPN